MLIHYDFMHYFSVLRWQSITDKSLVSSSDFFLENRFKPVYTNMKHRLVVSSVFLKVEILVQCEISCVSTNTVLISISDYRDILQ